MRLPFSGKEYEGSVKSTHGFEAAGSTFTKTKGKRGGAYSAGQIVHPYVLLNYKGHAGFRVHAGARDGTCDAHLSRKNQEPVDREYVIFVVAEVASTCNESLLMQHLLKKTPGQKTRAYLINYFLEQFRTTPIPPDDVCRVRLKINELVKRRQLNGRGLNKIYHDLNVFYYGNTVICGRLNRPRMGENSAFYFTTIMCSSIRRAFPLRWRCLNGF